MIVFVVINGSATIDEHPLISLPLSSHPSFPNINPSSKRCATPSTATPCCSAAQISSEVYVCIFHIPAKQATKLYNRMYLLLRALHFVMGFYYHKHLISAENYCKHLYDGGTKRWRSVRTHWNIQSFVKMGHSLWGTLKRELLIMGYLSDVSSHQGRKLIRSVWVHPSTFLLIPVSINLLGAGIAQSK
jgi:hypothetical protein